MSLRAAKQTIRMGLGEPSLAIAAQRQRSYPNVLALMASEDFQESPRAVAEKRKPVWSGR